VEVGLWLVVQDQLVALQGASQAAEQRQPSRAVLVDRGVVDDEPGVGLLGGVHGDIGVLQQLGGVAAVVGVDGDPDTGVQVEADPVQGERLVERDP